MNNILNWNRKENGYTLAGVLLIFLIVSVLGMSIIALSVNAMKISTKEHDNQSTFYIAESGTTYRVAQVQVLVDSATTEMNDLIDANPGNWVIPGGTQLDEEKISKKFFEILDTKLNPDPNPSALHVEKYINFEEIKNHNPEAQITVEREILVDLNENPRQYNITSKGIVGNEERTVNLPVNIEWFPKPQYAILTKEGINIVGKEIHGDIGVISPDAEVIVFPGGNPLLNGEIFVPGGDPNAIKIGAPHLHAVIPMPPKALDENTDIPSLPDFPTYPTLSYKPDIVGVWGGSVETTLTSDGSYQLITVPSGMTYTINIGSQNRIIVVDQLNVNGNLIINGSGKLTIYVKDKFHTGYEMGSSGSIGSSTKINDINMYFAGDIIRLGGNARIYGSIYAEKAELNFGAGAGFMGNVLTGGSKVTMQGGSDIASQLILAPNAEVIHSNGVIKGMIVSKTYSASGGAELHFDQSTNVEGPLSLEEIMNDPLNVDNSFMQRMDPIIGKQSVREK